MKNILFFILFIVIGCMNDNKNEKKDLENEITELPPPLIVDKNSFVGFACGPSGESSEIVDSITEILKNKKYNELKKNLFSNKPAEKYLATFTCLKLLEKETIELDADELNQIAENKKSDLKISFCSGCTIRESYKMAQLFSGKTELGSDAEFWFNRMKKH